MASPRHAPFPLWDILARSARFFYLLWGGMLLASLSYFGRWRPPVILWHWPRGYEFLAGPWGRGLGLGLGLVMAIAALREVWELVDRFLVHLSRNSEP